MSDTATRAELGNNPNVRAVPLAELTARKAERSSISVIAVLITLATAALAGAAGWAMWNAYMGAPWTRDGTVRAYVVTMAPEIEGRIVELPVVDNQLVHKGDLLLVIDPTNYRIGLELSEAAVRQAKANAQNIAGQIPVQEAQVSANKARWSKRTPR